MYGSSLACWSCIPYVSDVSLLRVTSNCQRCYPQARTLAIQIPLFYTNGELHSYILSYRSGIAAAAAGVSVHEGWLGGIGSGVILS